MQGWPPRCSIARWGPLALVVLDTVDGLVQGRYLSPQVTRVSLGLSESIRSTRSEGCREARRMNSSPDTPNPAEPSPSARPAASLQNRGRRVRRPHVGR
jgi:hypothetical protein